MDTNKISDTKSTANSVVMCSHTLTLYCKEVCPLKKFYPTLCFSRHIVQVRHEWRDRGTYFAKIKELRWIRPVYYNWHELRGRVSAVTAKNSWNAVDEKSCPSSRPTHQRHAMDFYTGYTVIYETSRHVKNYVQGQQQRSWRAPYYFTRLWVVTHCGPRYAPMANHVFAHRW